MTFNNLEHKDKVHKTQQTVTKATRSAAAHMCQCVCVCVCVCVSEMIRSVSVVDSGVMLIKIITYYSQHQRRDACSPQCLLAPQMDYLLNYPSSQTHSKMYENVIHLAPHKYFTPVSQ